MKLILTNFFTENQISHAHLSLRIMNLRANKDIAYIDLLLLILMIQAKVQL